MSTINVPQLLTQLSLASGYAIESRSFAHYLNENDKLKYLRYEFHYPKMGTLPQVDLSLVNSEDDAIYLCGNSLCLMPRITRDVMNQQFDKWSQMGWFGHIAGNYPWTICDEEICEEIGSIVGAEASEIAMMNGLTVNIHALLTAFYKPTEQRHKILLESRAFSSTHYAIESQIRLKGFDAKTSMICLNPRVGEECLRIEDILDLIETEGDSIAVVFFSGIQYYTGQFFDIERITRAGQAQGCLVGWDLAHAFANVPLHLDLWNVDFACWCTYKYGCSGAGGLAGIYVNKRFEKMEGDRLVGWWGQKFGARFLMNNELDLSLGASGFRLSMPPMMLVMGVIGFLEVYKKTSIEEARKKSIVLTGYLQHLLTHRFTLNAGKISCNLITPTDPEQRGCQLSLKFNVDVSTIWLELTKRGVVCDKRFPNVIRVAPVHYYNNFMDVWRFAHVLKDVILGLEQNGQFDGI
ncbi:hypothetical protein L596_016512 [Steinernema carpocapsae]|uniref:Kynureninase n=1 Tax=Steinernema carpocapsae TaxID=34508 RepID=A0A4U5NI62_STECR|nr:hypothetical protein L596_016512 [Steinernema carpocapsae]